ncbi:hypothetical protein ASC89_00290 [Devosia sp. Root413D1]|nr:hypothetical protein ASC89_00290 [Devosia sp. Root413D1]
MSENVETWKARLTGTPSLMLGWSTAEGKGNELSYLLLPVEFIAPRGRSVPGVLSIFATDVLDAADAGLIADGPGPGKTATIATTRAQFSDLVGFVQAGRVGDFQLHAQNPRGRERQLVSWSVAIALR